MTNRATLVRQDTAAYITDTAILADLLGTSRHRATEILQRLPLDRARQLASEELAHAAGITPRQARALAAANAYARRTGQDQGHLPPRYINCPEDAINLLLPARDERTQEELHIILLTTRNQIISTHMPYRGNVNSSIVRPAELLRPAILAAAPSMVMMHNHPGGDPTPSSPDVDITKEVHAAAAMMGINLLDHIVTAPDRRFVSMKEQRLLADDQHVHHQKH